MARQKEFDPDVALDRAMTLFWEQGYAKTSMQELVARMGIHKRSMYDTFGDKRALYLKALDRYAETVEQVNVAAAERQTDGRAALRGLFESALPGGGQQPLGCLSVNTATELALRDPDAAARVEKSFARQQQLVLDLIRRGQETGQIAAHHDPRGLALTLFNAWVGLRVRVRTGAPRAQLRQMVDDMMTMLD
ncbi:TetR family transcriptional regulator [Asanoa ferruginea]|uniref:TetR family transcriptional regulator n=1 Tax=Asanoa ferruginea TaxID=53367 RepID=A0A3D9ZU69_9ACTN|nr:TetR/AcrR family transcriptional regulator [Asanoa ferruginea]REG00708.1 TetR family transcriptional regulator [Asanoa ferruginea]GIF47418.1 TetR family transcriptional regulator [Asanoa ferruginea]